MVSVVTFESLVILLVKEQLHHCSELFNKACISLSCSESVSDLGKAVLYQVQLVLSRKVEDDESEDDENLNDGVEELCSVPKDGDDDDDDDCVDFRVGCVGCGDDCG